jgi:hypothetical protein
MLRVMGLLSIYHLGSIEFIETFMVGQCIDLAVVVKAGKVEMVMVMVVVVM